MEARFAFLFSIIVASCSSTTGPALILCQNDAQCPEGLLCRDGACRSSCTTTIDCPQGYVCISGACLKSCLRDADCPQGEVCSEGFCRPGKLVDGGDGFDGSDGTDGGEGDDGEGGEEGRCQPGAIEECGSDVGECRKGQHACRSDGTWGECIGGRGPRDESCNGLDDDCDGLTDEELTSDICNQLGVCKGTLAVCELGKWVCHFPPAYRNPDDTCDGVDNDCDGVPDSGLICGGTCCALGQICRYDQCLDVVGNCVTDEDCQEDSWCDNGTCIPYGQGPRGDTNPDCTRLIIAGLFQPALQCEWLGPPPGDPYPNHVQVLGTPMVADFDFDNDPNTIRPSLVFNTYDALDGDSGVMTDLDGVIRIIDGATCETQFSLGPYTNGCNPVAIGDIDLDGRPEIVAHRNTAGIIAYKYVPQSGTWVELWRGHTSNGTEVVFSEGATGWGGPSIIDLNDDGLPEILSGGLIYDSSGLLLDSHLGLGGLFRTGFPVAADLDLDGRVELAGGDFVWQFDQQTSTWAVEANGPQKGYTAVADFGTFGPDPAADNRQVLDGIAEIVIVSGGVTRIINVSGRTVFGPLNLPASTGGGPPTIGDFDGDGRAEYAAAGSDSMTVFDPDCQGAPEAKYCPTLRTDGILWTQPSQDHSSNITGSSLFDFEGDGKVEAVYADECFVRVYNGSDGRVLYSQWRTSCTWNENPIVADVDGDYSAELVVPSNRSCGTRPQNMGGVAYETSPNGNPMDPLFVGLPCKDGADCISGVCDAGYCRCTQHSECGGPNDGFVCAPPPAGTPGAGNTCRAEWRGSINGVRVYRDVLDRWVGSRTIWNQHAYSVTNVEENGRIPRTSQVTNNWQVAGLNNFRQNVQGNLRPDTSPDLTAGRGEFLVCDAQGNLTLKIRVCNRGTYPISAGVAVGFYDGEPAGGNLICTGTTGVDLQPGQCTEVSCIWANAPVNDPHDVAVVVDPNSERTECIEGNNRAWIRGATCWLE